MTDTTHDRGYSVAQFAVVIAILVVLVGAGALLLQGAGPGTGPSAANVPPAGQVWFGQSFDPKTYAMTGQTAKVGTQQPVALVAHLSRTVDAATGITIRASHDGVFVTSVPMDVSGATGDIDVVGTMLGALVVPGAWRYDLVDIGGNVLASGTVVAG